MTVILGIDPGSRITGFGFIKQEGKKLHYVASGCIRIKEESLAARLKEIYDGLSELIAFYKPHEVSIESVFMHQNPQAALKLGQARGAAIVAATRVTQYVAEYTPRQIKQAVVGSGAAQKAQVQQMICHLLSLADSPQADAADALAAAITHAHTRLGLASLKGVKAIKKGRLK